MVLSWCLRLEGTQADLRETKDLTLPLPALQAVDSNLGERGFSGCMPGNTVMRTYSKVTALAAALIMCLGTQAFAQQVAVVIAAKQGAEVITASGTRQLERSDSLQNGDVIQTNGSGTVQIAFRDKTRMVVGPESRFVIDDVDLGAGEKARTFAIDAVSGTFRFLSGQSEKQVYSISTPTATMGIRGTQFDFTVTEGEGTSLVTFRGEVRICSNRNRCARASGGCAAVGTRLSGDLVVPADRIERDELILSEFPFIISQQILRPSFRSSTRSCGRIAGVLGQIDKGNQTQSRDRERTRSGPTEDF